MKTIRNLVQLCLLGMVLLALPAEMHAQFTYTTNNGAITITGYTGPGGPVTFPNTINGYPVTTIGDGSDRVFDYTSVTSVTIGTNVTSIGAYAFQSSYLTSVTIPNSVTTIGEMAFEDCENLTTVTIGTGLTLIDQQAFYDCYNLTAVYLYCGTPTEGLWVFNGDTAVEFYYLTEVDELSWETAVFAGTSATFMSGIASTPNYPPTYQWQTSTNNGATWSNLNDGNGITGSTTWDLTINNTTISMSGNQFRMVANNVAGQFMSNVSTLTVLNSIQLSFNIIQTFEYPAAANGTFFTGISGGNIIGYYVDTNNYENGFLFNVTNRTYVPLDYTPNGIDGNYIVGNDQWGLWPYLYNIATRTYTTPVVPAGYYGTYLTGVSGEYIVGNELLGYEEGEPSYRGFLYNISNQTYILLGGEIIGISGNYVIGNGCYYNITNQTWTYLGLPETDGSCPVYCTAIDGGTIIGQYYDYSYFNYLYNYATQSYGTFESDSPITGISGNYIVGYCNSSNGCAGFLATLVTTTLLPSGDVDVPYSQALTAPSGQTPYNWTINTGVLPPGLILATNGIISGTPVSAGTFNFTVQVTDANNDTVTQALVLTVIPLQVDSYLPDGMNYTAYFWQLNASGGLPPYSLSLISGSLPSGLTLATNGTISGMPVSAGTFNFTVQVTDANNNTVTQALSLNIDAYASTSAAYAATESWSVTLTLGTGTGLSTQTYNGTKTGTLTVINGDYQLINLTGYPVSGSMNLSRSIVYSYGAYSIEGSECGEGGIGGEIYAIIPLNFFLIAIPIGSESGFSGGWAAYSYPYSATGTSLSSFSGSGAYVDNNYPDDDLGYLNEVDWSSTSSLTEVVDTTLPTVAITSPTSGQSVSNNVFTVAGTASDNVAVMSVFYSLNNAGWATATTANNWSNWNAAVTLVPGTNTIAAFVVDTSGNVSKTNTVTFKYVVSAPLTVQMTGRGTVSPNYSNAVLQVGTTYSMTALAGTGFMFTNWTGGTNGMLTVLTNRPTLQFVMQSNLVLQASFVDTNKPVLAITNLVAGQMVSNASFMVMGWATDNVAVASVYCSLSNAVASTGFGLVPTANNWLNWSTNETLVAGTNTIRAYAVDTSGNVSTTNSVNLDYVVSAILTVSTNGLGSLNPNYNQALLQIGKNYSITATPGTGFMFTNWTGGTSLPLAFLTNGTTVTFMMVSNLILQANFVETSKPTLNVTNLTAGQRVSNAVFTVKGTTSDNWGVSNVVCQVNGGGWNSATNINNWTNWAAGVTLVPGTNVFQAYAVNLGGNSSTTNSVSIQYAVTNQLQVRMAGLGTISPNYSNALLNVGQNYSMTATPGSGFVFTNWTISTNWIGGSITNNATVQFMMQSNLTLQATFADVTKPVLAITNLTSGQRASNAVFTVRGTAGDNWQVSNVLCQINGGGWNSATNINNWTNWAAGVLLLPGTNVVQAYAVDTSGNVSLTNTVSFQFLATNQLQVRAAGLGTLSPNYSNAWLNVGQNYSMSASPGTGFVFTNWTISTNWIGGSITNNATVQFMMTSNLTLQANFVDTSKPTLSITNLVSGQWVSNAVFTVKGTASDNWQVGNVAYNLNSGAWSNALPVNSWSNWSATVNLVPGTNTIAAYAADTTGNLSTTNAVSFQYVVTNLLRVRATGPGTLSPNYSNAWLNIGQNYSMTATPGSGSVATNWTISTNWIGGIITNNATVQFMMASNLTLQINFADVTKPTLTITAPTAGQHMTNALATFAGTASDNWQVSAVWYQLTNAILPGGTWSLATTTNGYTNWTTTVTLAAGTNTIKAYAVDLGGNYSATNNLSVLSSNTFKLQLALTNTLPLKTNGLVFSLQLSTGLNGRIQVSSNLTTWDTLTNFVGTNATLNFLDPAATNSNHRFYRAVIP